MCDGSSVWTTLQMCNRVTNPSDMDIFFKQGLKQTSNSEIPVLTPGSLDSTHNIGSGPVACSWCKSNNNLKSIDRDAWQLVFSCLLLSGRYNSSLSRADHDRDAVAWLVSTVQPANYGSVKQTANLVIAEHQANLMKILKLISLTLL